MVCRTVAGPCGRGLSQTTWVSTSCGLVAASPRMAAWTVASGVGSVGSMTSGARTGWAVGLKMSRISGLLGQRQQTADHGVDDAVARFRVDTGKEDRVDRPVGR